MSDELELNGDPPRFLEHTEVAALRAKAEFLLGLDGELALSVDSRSTAERALLDAILATEDDVEILNDIYQQREREANLRGIKWTPLP